MLPVRLVRLQVVPAEEAYCTLQPSRLTAVAPLLRSSMKSFFSVAPLLPPPPYTWLITTCACAVAASSRAATKNSVTAMRRLRGMPIDRVSMTVNACAAAGAAQAGSGWRNVAEASAPRIARR